MVSNRAGFYLLLQQNTYHLQKENEHYNFHKVEGSRSIAKVFLVEMYLVEQKLYKKFKHNQYCFENLKKGSSEWFLAGYLQQ